jgi:hypothetical protein
MATMAPSAKQHLKSRNHTALLVVVVKLVAVEGYFQHHSISDLKGRWASFVLAALVASGSAQGSSENLGKDRLYQSHLLLSLGRHEVFD